MTHTLKTWPEYFQSVWDGDKTFEVRKADRPFTVGDAMILAEYLPLEDRFTGRQIHTIITYILQGGQFGIEEDTCVIGFRK